MKIVKGSKIEELNAEQIREFTKNFDEKILDIGTGDGRFIFKNAKQNPHFFYIGLDTNQQQLEIYSRKINKFRLNNAVLALGTIEQFPTELENMFDRVYIHFPWGSLLGGLVNKKEEIIKNIVKGLEHNGILQIIFGYSSEAEPTEVDRLQLESINIEKIKKEMVPAFNKLGLELTDVEELDKESLADIETTWGKKLAFGQDRCMFRLSMCK